MLFRYALVTPSYDRDYDLCRFLCESIEQYVTPQVKHYILIERKDYPIFRSLLSPHREIVLVEEMLPNWLFRLPLQSRWWMSAKTWPVRNWVMQQMEKLLVASFVDEEVLVFLDSDTAFIKPFDCGFFEREGRVRLFRVPDEGNIPSHYPWHRTAGKLLGIERQDYYGAKYIGFPNTWIRENVLKLHRRIEKVRGMPWQEAVLRQWHLSEFILYGVFIDKVLGEKGGHFYDAVNICLDYWLQENIEEEKYLDRLRPEHSLAMISSKAPISFERYKNIMKKLQNNRVLTN